MNHPKIAHIISTCVFWGLWPIWYLRLVRAERSRVLVVANGTDMLVLKSWHAPYKWSLPGGGIKNGEDPAASAERELREETSLIIDATTLYDAGRLAFHDRGLRFRCHYFIATIPKKQSIQSHPPEVLEVRWMPISSISQSDDAFGADVIHAVSAWQKMLQ